MELKSPTVKAQYAPALNTTPSDGILKVWSPFADPTVLNFSNSVPVAEVFLKETSAVAAPEDNCNPLILVLPAKITPNALSAIPTVIAAPVPSSTETSVTVKKYSELETVLALTPVIVSVSASPFASVPVIVNTLALISEPQVTVISLAVLSPKLATPPET